MDQPLSQFPELANILAASLNEIYLFDAESLRFRFANLGALQNLGYTLSQMQAMIVPDIKPEYSPARFRELIRPLIEHQKSILAFETVHQRADGSHYPVDVRLQLFEWDGENLFLAVILDITDRKQFENALLESEAKYRQLFELESDALFLIDNEEGQILDANETAVSLYGYSKEELLSLRNVDLSAQPEETRQATAQRLHNIFVRYHCKKNGAIFPVEITATHLSWKGRLVHIAAIRDITERLQVEQALRQSEARLRYIIQHDPNAIVVLDRDLRYLAASQRYLRDYGIQEQNIIGKYHYDVFPDMPQSWREIHQRVLSGAVERNDDDYFVRPDGTVEYYRWECRPWRQTDGSIGGLVVYSEITTERKLAEQKLKESEEKFRTLFECMAQGVVYQDADYKITEANPAALRILGLTMEQIQGRTSMDPRWRSIHEDGSVFPGETHAAIVALQTGQEVKNVVMGVFNPLAESYNWININAVPQFRPGEDKPYQAFTTFEDITVRKKNEMQLKEQLEELRRWHATVIGREKRVLELKQEVNELLRQAGRPPRYLSVEDYKHDE
jgi:PAS domain S-box-containing protein